MIHLPTSELHQTARRWTRHAAAVLAWLCAVHLPAAGAQASPSPDAWPVTITWKEGTLTVYPLQLDRWDGGTLSGRSAVRAAVGKDKPRVTYGIVALSARALTDKGRRRVTLDEVKVDSADFPAASPEDAARFSAFLANGLARRSRTVGLDTLEAALAASSEARQSQNAPLRNDPPRILFSEVPAILVSIDGPPAFRPVAGTSLDRVINTRPLLLRDARQRLLLRVFDGWLESGSPAGPWTLADETPEMARVLKDALAARQIDPLRGKTLPDEAAPTLHVTLPVIYVATSPTELIVLAGAARYVPIAGTQLMFAQNTTGHVLRHIGDGNVYVLVSGRWFRAPREQGPWTFVGADSLPPDFARIPDDSPKENLKASVAGTAQAREAAIAATVAQTAVVTVGGTQLSPPRFDGEPVLRPIAMTSLDYVANTPMPIIRVGTLGFYALENGVWFESRSATGPWTVARGIPPSIYAIPPSSPLHYVTYARIYDVQGDAVYVGYTPGYEGTVIDPQTGVVVYGTGYVYDPWVGTVWVGAPYTYGFGASVAYTPWTGWAVAFGFGWAWGAATSGAGWGWGPYPWWGPWGWGWAWGPAYPWYPAWSGAVGPRGGAAVWGPGGWAGYSGNIYRNWGDRSSVSRVAGGYNAWTGNAWAGQVGAAYNSRTGAAAAGQRGAVANAYTGNYAAGNRGVARGPGGNVVAGGRVTAGNAYTGSQATANRGAAYNRATGEVTTFGGVRGAQGAVGHIGDDVYAGHDGNVYRHTDGGGWQQHTAGGGWQPVPGSAAGEATRSATGGLGATRAPGAPVTQHLDLEQQARSQGAMRSQSLQQSTRSMGQMRSGGRGRR